MADLSYFFVVDHETGVCSCTWRVWVRGSSFYLLARYPTVSGVKISLHGPDQRHSGYRFKIAPDGPNAIKARAAGGIILGTEAMDFPGDEVADGVRRAVVFRFTRPLVQRRHAARRSAR